MICQFAGTTNLLNSLCTNCSLHLETCVPIHSPDGYALGSECDQFLCPGCQEPLCQADLERDHTA